MLAGVGFEDEIFDVVGAGFLDEFFDKSKTAVVGVEGNGGFFF